MGHPGEYPQTRADGATAHFTSRLIQVTSREQVFLVHASGRSGTRNTCSRLVTWINLDVEVHG